MSKSKKTSYMQSKGLLSESFWNDFKAWIRKDQVIALNKKLDKLNVKKDKVKGKLSKEVDDLNKAMARFDAALQKQYKIKTGKTPKLKVDDFIDES